MRALPGLDRLVVGWASGTLPFDSVLVCEPNRPLLTVAMLTEFLERTHDDRLAALACPVPDTYKTVRAGTVQSTLDRTSVWELQGLTRFNQRSFNTVQDLEAARAAGIPVRLVQGDPTNFAVRTADDCRVAELVLSK